MAQEGSNSAKVLLSYVERIEKLEEEKKDIASDIKDLKAEAKGVGFDMPTLNEMLKLRKLNKEKLQEKEELRDQYINALDLI